MHLVDHRSKEVQMDFRKSKRVKNNAYPFRIRCTYGVDAMLAWGNISTQKTVKKGAVDDKQGKAVTVKILLRRSLGLSVC